MHEEVREAVMPDIDWDAIPCRHPMCRSNAVGIYYVPEGCNCFEDPVQALCEQHFIKLHSTGAISTIISCHVEDEEASP